MREIYAIAQAHNALLMVDEAHATGVVGPNGTGTAPLLGLAKNSPGLVLTGSLSKALGGASGGYVAGSHEIIDHLQNSSRSWIFTKGMTTANAAMAFAALNICKTDPAPLGRLRINLEQFRSSLKFCGLTYYDSNSAITGLRIGDEDRTRELSNAFAARGRLCASDVLPSCGSRRSAPSHPSECSSHNRRS